MKTILEISDLSHSYGDEIFTITDFSFSLKEGEITSIIGASGIGKTTLLRIIAGYLETTSGSSTYKKNDSVQDIQYIGQKHALKNNLSIQKNISLWELLKIL